MYWSQSFHTTLCVKLKLVAFRLVLDRQFVPVHYVSAAVHKINIIKYNGTWQQALNPTLLDGHMTVFGLALAQLFRGELLVLRLLQLSGKAQRTLACFLNSQKDHPSLMSSQTYFLCLHLFIGVGCEILYIQ